ncbi:hypothetical protein TrLO_g6010 [Triparma laevis f. longispina]|uniref:Major facilitator superfamily (MFS) profile domain-containing protein n=1 Tax=Triparma laevis f. longispina TaxID=1714387 RepID=A0A9W7APC7_9STRA|nr:hypothetical protein TrLO_g6010 [Triparma laevis f. longispina]
MSSTTSTPLLPRSGAETVSGPNYSSLISALSNLSIQYNLSVIGIALLIMDPQMDDPPSPPLYPRTDEQDSLLKSSVFAGAVAKGFFWQTPGVILPYLVAWILVKSFGSDKNGSNYASITEAQFRILFGVGALPSAVVIYLTYLQFKGKKRERTGSENIVKVAFRNPQLWRKLFGTGMTWCLYDFVYYGTAFNQPDIINAVFGKDESIVKNCEHNILLASMGLPGVILAIYNLEKLGSKKLMSWGFVAIGIASVALSASFAYAPNDNVLNFILTCFMVFATNWGCNVATYVLPTETFPAEVRSSFYGLSAAMGKVGAFFGGYFFKQIADTYNYSTIYATCAILSGLGVGISSGYIVPFWEDNFVGTSVRESEPYVRRSTNNTDNKGEMISAA